MFSLVSALAKLDDVNIHEQKYTRQATQATWVGSWGKTPTKTLHVCSAFFILQVEIESCKKKEAAESSLFLFNVPDRLLL